ncbi:MAG TPA: 50S ribosomal protein L11 methyltransferase [Alphaproteobacteria bacterium]|nr:50S ribosomal protein L11 methyltransferase [Alphaproteobacteria bacterium]
MNRLHTDFVRAQTAPCATALVPEIRLHLAGEVTPLWEATEASLAETGLPPPFWAFAWPGGQAIARTLLDRPELAQGRTVLDFAAGCGIAAIAAARAGAARVRASEIDPFAAAAIALNADANDVAVEVLEADLLAAPAARHDLILAGDLCYERPMAERVFAWLSAAARAGAEVLLADPGRAYLPKAGLVEIASHEVRTTLELENRTSMVTRVFRLEAE